MKRYEPYEPYGHRIENKDVKENERNIKEEKTAIEKEKAINSICENIKNINDNIESLDINDNKLEIIFLYWLLKRNDINEEVILEKTWLSKDDINKFKKDRIKDLKKNIFNK